MKTGTNSFNKLDIKIMFILSWQVYLGHNVPVVDTYEFIWQWSLVLCHQISKLWSGMTHTTFGVFKMFIIDKIIPSFQDLAVHVLIEN